MTLLRRYLLKKKGSYVSYVCFGFNLESTIWDVSTVFFNQQGMNQGNSFDHYWQIRWSCIFMIFTSPNQHGWVWKRTWQCSQCMPRFTESDGFVDQQRCFRWEDIGKFWNAPPPSRSDKWRQYVSCPRDPRCNVILGGRASQARCTFDRQRGHQTYPNMPLCIPSALPIFPPSTFAPIKIELAIFRGAFQGDSWLSCWTISQTGPTFGWILVAFHLLWWKPTVQQLGLEVLAIVCPKAVISGERFWS